MPVRRVQSRRHAHAGGAAALQRPLPRDDQHAGGGYSRWRDLAVTRWREDATCDRLGHLLLPARPGRRRGVVGRLPADAGAPTATKRSSPSRGRSSAGATTRSRRTPRSRSRRRTTSSCAACGLTNRSRARRDAGGHQLRRGRAGAGVADALHPAFSNLFVQTELVPARQAILCTRRPRSSEERPPWMLHLMAVHGAATGAVSYETDRAALHRPGQQRAPTRRAARRRPAVRHRGPGARPDRGDPAPDRARARADRAARPGHRRRRIARGRARAGREVPGSPPGRPRLRTGLDAQPGRAAAARRHRSRRAALRPPGRRDRPRQRLAARRGQRSSAQPQGAVGPVGLRASRATCRSCCCGSATPTNIDLVRELVQAHAYWRLKGLAVDLVIWNEDAAATGSVLHDQIMGLDRRGRRSAAGRPARRRLRAPGRADLRGGPHPAAGGGARDRHRRAAARSSRAGPAAPAAARRRFPLLQPARGRARRSADAAEPPARRLICCSTTASAASRATGAST